MEEKCHNAAHPVEIAHVPFPCVGVSSMCDRIAIGYRAFPRRVARERSEDDLERDDYGTPAVHVSACRRRRVVVRHAAHGTVCEL